ncbi:MAG: DUF1905 domain-containing protein [Lachnospiraceae bacterium]|nr:DUF1905 domain-containing protein [Lachnospiraceae bacterium]
MIHCFILCIALADGLSLSHDTRYQFQCSQKHCYIIGVTKVIRNKICKTFGDEIAVTIREC